MLSGGSLDEILSPPGFSTLKLAPAGPLQGFIMDGKGVKKLFAPADPEECGTGTPAKDAETDVVRHSRHRALTSKVSGDCHIERVRKRKRGGDSVKELARRDAAGGGGGKSITASCESVRDYEEA